MSVVVGLGNPTLNSYGQHIRGLREEAGRTVNAMMDWDRPGRAVEGERMTLVRTYNELCSLVHQTVFVDPVSRRRGRSLSVQL